MKLQLIASALFATTFLFPACGKKDNTITPDENQHSDKAVSAKVDGANFQSNSVGALANSSAGTFIITAEDSNEHSITLTGPTTVGTFDNSVNNNTSGMYISKSGEVWMSSLNNGTITLTITKFDAAAKKMSGRFSFTAAALSTSGATGNKTITNGTFTDVAVAIQ